MVGLKLANRSVAPAPAWTWNESGRSLVKFAVKAKIGLPLLVFPILGPKLLNAADALSMIHPFAIGFGIAMLNSFLRLCLHRHAAADNDEQHKRRPSLAGQARFRSYAAFGIV